MATATTAPWTAKTENHEPTQVHIELLDGSVLTVPTRTWDCEILVAGFFKEGFFRVQENGVTVYYAAHQIKKITPAIAEGKR